MHYYNDRNMVIYQNLKHKTFSNYYSWMVNSKSENITLSFTKQSNYNLIIIEIIIIAFTKIRLTKLAQDILRELERKSASVRITKERLDNGESHTSIRKEVHW